MQLLEAKLKEELINSASKHEYAGVEDLIGEEEEPLGCVLEKLLITP